jgi:NADH dehydrogenase
MSDTTAVVTGAFGYLGRYATRLLLERGVRVRTLTDHPRPEDPLARRIEVLPFHFDDPAALVADLAGADVVLNTYWVRFPHGRVTYGQAVANTENLIRAARAAGVRRFVHVSITNPSLDSPLPYFHGKAVLERTLAGSGLSSAIVRPTVLFGAEDILINNIAWLARRLPAFGVFGRGDYRLQPVFAGDVARLMVDLAAGSDDVAVDAVGPETYAFEDLVRLVCRRVGASPRLVHVPPWLGRLAGRALGLLVRDVVITRAEIDGLMADLLVSSGPPTCPTRFSAWVADHAATLGRRYASELGRHYRPLAPAPVT